MIELAGIDHVVFRVRDMTAMIAFYEKALGASVERQVDDLGLVQLRAGSALIDLVDCAAPLGLEGGTPAGDGGRNVEHVCLRILSWDEPALRTHFASFGITELDMGRRYGADGFGPSLYLSDPEGNRIELKGPPEEPIARK